MSHGSKKWIVDYRGKIKRSNNRTKIDFYAGLRMWNVWYVHSLYHGNQVQTKDFCPQCKHVQKAIQNDLEGYRAAEKKIREEWKALYGDRYWVDRGAKTLWFHDFFRNHKDYPGNLWNYDFRSYLCYKHERMYEQERQMWHDHVNGEKRRYGWSVKDQRRSYRRKVKHIMDRAKYDEDVYEEIPPKRREWLD